MKIIIYNCCFTTVRKSVETMSGEYIAIDKIKDDQHIHITEPKEQTISLDQVNNIKENDFGRL